MSEQPFLIADPSSPWIKIKDADPTARSIFDRHYSRYRYADGRKPAKFIGPGQYMLLVTQDARAIFAWRKFISVDGQTGVSCCIFRNEGSESGISSALILAAMQLAWERWPGERLFTYIDPGKVRAKRDPGRCFIRAGWKQCGVTKARKLLIFECQPPSGEPK